MVYFVICEMSKLVKIGTTTDMSNRFKNLQASSGAPLRILKTINGGTEEERQLHRQFHHLRHHGEWFMLADDLFDYLEKYTMKPLFELKSEPVCNNCPIRANAETAKGEPFYERIKNHTLEVFKDDSLISKFMTEKELEKHLQLNSGELKEWRKRKTLPFPAYQVFRKTLYKIEEVNDWLKAILLM